MNISTYEFYLRYKSFADSASESRNIASVLYGPQQRETGVTRVAVRSAGSGRTTETFHVGDESYLDLKGALVAAGHDVSF